MSLNPSQDPQGGRSLAKSVGDHWVMFLIEGIVLSALGVLAMVIPPLATLAATIFIGWLFVLSGVLGLATTFWMKNAPGFGWALVSGILGIVAGGVLIASPVSGAVSITLVLIAFFFVEGIATIMYALAHRQDLSGRWGFMLVSGLIDLVLAVMILAGLPGTAAWALGLLVGINMLFGGGAMIAMALSAKPQTPGSTAPRGR